MQELKYGLKDGELISIEEATNGLECGCICPACGAILIAKQGNVNAHHFAHYNATDCEHGKETALHIMGKKVVSEMKKAFFPINNKEHNYGSVKGEIRSYSIAVEEKLIDFSIKPDVLLVSGNEQISVEIKVTHAVEEEKKYKLFNANLTTIEIDLSDLIDNYDEEIIRERILSGEKTKWLYSSLAKNDFLAEWFGDFKKKRIKGKDSTYVLHCPLDNNNFAYFAWFGSKYECHDCGYWEMNVNYGIYGVLCMGKLKGIKIDTIEKINEIKRIEGELVYFDIVANGERVIREYQHII